MVLHERINKIVCLAEQLKFQEKMLFPGPFSLKSSKLK